MPCQTIAPKIMPTLFVLASYSLTCDAQFDPVLEVNALDGSNGFALQGVAAGDHSGSSVGSAGDINDDDIDDLIIGAPDSSPQGTGSGNSYVLFGGSNISQGFDTLLLSGLDGIRGFALNGVVAGDRSGSSVSAVGDVNDDGMDDLIIGSPMASPQGAASGNSHVLFGGPNVNQGFSSLFLSGLIGVRGFALNGAAAGDISGASVSAAGDINDDGIDDLIIGAPDASPQGAGSGNSHVLFGGPNVNLGFASLFLSGLDGITGFALNGATMGDRSGTSVSTIGDINADGIDDLIVGAPTASPLGVDSGISHVLFGGPNVSQGFASLFLSGLNGVTGFALHGATAGELSGSSVSAAGDINADGIDDLIIGAPNASPFGVESGASFVLFGKVDVNAGFSALLLSGLNGDSGFAFTGVSAGDHSGAAVSLAGDVNNDGIDDLIIGAPDASPNGVGSGSVYVVFGSTDVNHGFDTVFLSSLNGRNGFCINGANAGDHLGYSVGSIGDVNNDGIDDIIVGAPDADSGGIESGNSYVIFGRISPIFSDGFEEIGSGFCAP